MRSLLGVAGLAFADGASENESSVLGKITPKKLDKKKWKPVTLYNGVTTSTTHAVPGQQNAEKVTVLYPKNIKFDFDAGPTCARAAARDDHGSGERRVSRPRTSARGSRTRTSATARMSSRTSS